MIIYHQSRPRKQSVLHGESVEDIHIKSVIDAFTNSGNCVTNASAVLVKVNSKNKKKLLSFLLNRFPKIFNDIFAISYNLIAFKKMYKSYKSVKFDCIYERWAPYQCAGALFSKIFRVPLLLELNSTLRLSDTNINRIYFYKFCSFLEKYVQKVAYALFPVTNTIRDDVVKNVNCNKIFVVQNAADPKIFNSSVDNSDIVKTYGLNNNIVIGYCGSLQKWHGVDLLIEIFKKLSKTNRAFKLLIVGDGPEFDVLRNQVLLTRHNKDVIFTGRVQHQEIPKYVKAMDIAIMPDMTEMNSPVKIFEYMMMGKPIIAPDYSPINNMQNKDEYISVFKKKDIVDLEKKIKELLDNRELRISMGNKAREIALSHYTCEKNVEKIISSLKL